MTQEPADEKIDDKQPLTQEQEAQLANRVMRRQLTLGIQVSGIFLVLLLGLPLLNYFAPDVARINIGGFTLSWLILGVLFYPLTWLLSAYFIRESDRIETELAREEVRDNR